MNTRTTTRRLSRDACTVAPLGVLPVTTMRVAFTFAILLTVLFTGSARAATNQAAGKVLLVLGTVTATAPNGQQRRLKRRDTVYSGDSIQVSARGFTQIRYHDKSLMSLRPGTRLTIETFSFSGKQDGSERSYYKLVKGGLRTISGLIGKKHKKNYRVATPVATLGIRGTHYAMRLCAAGECSGSDGQPPAPEGLYVEVRRGATAIRNNTGERVFAAGQGYFVRSLNAAPSGRAGGFGFVFDKVEATLTSQPGGPKPGAAKEDNDKLRDDGEGPQGKGRPEGEGEGNNGKQSPRERRADRRESGGGAEQGEEGRPQAGGPESGPGRERALPAPDTVPREAPVRVPAPDRVPDKAQGVDPSGSAAPGPRQPAQPRLQRLPGAEPGVRPGSGPGPTGNLSPVNQLITGNAVASNTRQLPAGSSVHLSLFPTSDVAAAVGGSSSSSYEAVVSTAGGDIGALRQLTDTRGSNAGGEFRAASGALLDNGNQDGRIFWGRWGGAWEGRSAANSDFSIGQGHAHFIYAEAGGSVASLTGLGSGSAVFYLDPSLGTRPTNQSGSSGQLLHGAFEVDLGTQSVTALRLDVLVDQREFNARLKSTSSVNDALQQGLDLTGVCQGCSSSLIDGRSSLGFVDGAQSAAQAISGFYLQDSNGVDRVNGTAVFTRNQSTQASNDSVAALAFQSQGNNGSSEFTDFTATAGGGTQIELANINGVGKVPVRVSGPTANGSGEFNSSVARLVDSGGDAAGINWGRWDKDWRFSDAGVVKTTQASAHFIGTDQATSTTQLLATRANLGPVVAHFNRIGGTAPTDTQGTSGVVNQNSFDLDFGTLKVQNYRLNATVAGRTWDVQQGAAVSVSDAGQGFVTTGTCSGCQAGAAVTAVGRSNVTLVGSEASHAIGTWSVHDTAQTQGASGASAFQR